ncbi:MAG: aldehyde dehydrogenase family protein [Actinomycetales bacterium]|nr:aldehyde dehydrogenase family protein [Actinomycetales bacterium]
MIERRELYIDGQWVAPTSDEVITVDEAATEDIIGTVPAGDVTDAERAILAARRSADLLAEMPISDRADIVTAIAAGLREREDELARIMAQEVGTPMPSSLRVQVGLAATVFETIAEAARELPAEERVGNSMIIRVPAGVVGAITPWNYPLYQLAAKVGPALAAGCPVVVKPSSVAPLATFILADIVDGLGLPAGAFNLVSGRGALVGDLLSSHPQVDMVSLTGSTGAGVQVARAAAGTVKKVALELGGKSAFLLAEGADLDAAMAAAVRGCFVNNGQTCSATTRLIVPQSLLAEVEERVAALVGAMTVGNPLDDGVDIGPVASAAQYRTVSKYVDMGLEEGTLIAGGPGRVDGLDRGYFVKPTVFSRLDPGATIVQEEIFGPVLSIVAYDEGIEQGIAIANDNDYGLSGAVFAEDIPTAVSIARRLRTGQVAINGGRFNAKAPFGGFKQSGVGRELGHHGLLEYFELLSMQFPSADDLGSFGQTV